MHVPWYVMKSWDRIWIFRNARFRALENSSLQHWRHSHVISDKISSIVNGAMHSDGQWTMKHFMNDTQIKNTRIFIYLNIQIFKSIWNTKLSTSATLCKLFPRLLINWPVHVAKTWTDILQLYILQRNTAKFVKCMIFNRVTYIWIQVSFRFIRTDCNDYH